MEVGVSDGTAARRIGAEFAHERRRRCKVGASVAMGDLTERAALGRRIEELTAELAEMQRLTEVGQTVSALVHEVSQPLTAISNYVAGCRRLVAAGQYEQVGSALEQIADQTERAWQIIQRMRGFMK
jgi:two-component system, LuxR family, sensor kinase FixL